MKLHGLKKAMGDYRWCNSQGYYSGWRGCLMLDTADGEIWTDALYGNEWKVYHSDTIINLGSMMHEQNINVNMNNVKAFVEENFK